MVEAQHAVNNLREARAIELGLLSERREELLDKAAGLECTTFALSNILDRNDCCANYMTPRPSQRILYSAYTDARASIYRGESPVPALAFASEILIPMSGVITAGKAMEGTAIESFRPDGDMEDEYFAESLTQVMTGEYLGHYTITVHHDAQGQALAFQKSRHESSALLLRPVTVEGIKIPAATSVGLSRHFDSRKVTGRVKLDNDGTSTFLSYLVEGSLEVNPMRLTPWAYSEGLDRCSFAMEGAGDDFHYDDRRAELFEWYTLEDFRRAAETILEMCEIEKLPTARRDHR